MRIFVPMDSAAKALGADAVAQALSREAAARGLDVQIVRTGSRGMIWLEPLVEIERNGQRLAYGPVAPGDAARLHWRCATIRDAGLMVLDACSNA